tara:strand:+ start:561 stop:746 length:186 start_codon:yes stop_codon:yes gene_type:complete
MEIETIGVVAFFIVCGLAYACFQLVIHQGDASSEEGGFEANFVIGIALTVILVAVIFMIFD